LLFIEHDLFRPLDASQASSIRMSIKWYSYSSPAH
jgi:hypothetical protein